MSLHEQIHVFQMQPILNEEPTLYFVRDLHVPLAPLYGYVNDDLGRRVVRACVARAVPSVSSLMDSQPTTFFCSLRTQRHTKRVFSRARLQESKTWAI